MYVHEGGIRTPLVVHWPKQLPRHRVVKQPGHITDIFPSLMGIAGVNYPAKFGQGEATLPLEGQSFRPIWEGKSRQKLFEKGWEYEGNSAYRKGDWKLVLTYPEKQRELYDFKIDPVEINDLSAKNPAKIEEMKQFFRNWATQVGAEDPAVVRRFKKKGL